MKTNNLKWVLPPLVERFLRKRLFYFIPREIKSNIATNAKYKNIHSGKKCFVLATGPSINKQDLRPLANQKCISVGQFFHHDIARIIKPEYHVDSPVHPPYGDYYIKSYLDGIIKSYRHPHTIFLGHSFYLNSFYHYFKSVGCGIPSNVRFINYAGANQLDQVDLNDRGLWDITKTMFTPRTVVYMAIQVAAYMGFKEIYLIGCDQDYLIRYFNETMDECHFYEDNKSVGGQSSEYLKSFQLENWFDEYFNRWRQFRLINESLLNRGQKIFNATEGGMLDVFPRRKLDEVLKSI